MALSNPDAIVTEQDLADFYQGILPYLGAMSKDNTSIVYGMYIMSNESVPNSKILYLGDNISMTPARMDFTNDEFNYGSWEDAFFMPKPCMLKYDGTVDYYLDPDDYTKKENGTASDVADPTYPGNAMMEWPKIWLKVIPDANRSNKSAYVYISNKNVDGTYTDWPYHNSLGQSVNHFYTSIYRASLIDGVMRSISGVSTQCKNKTAQEELNAAMANNQTDSVIWTTENISEIDLIRYLSMLISKSTNSATSFGKGIITYNYDEYVTSNVPGVHNTKGLFYGTNSGSGNVSSNSVKVFGMENWWGLQGKRYLGEVMVNGTRKRKLTYGTEDGSTTTGFNFTGEGYIDCELPALTTSNDSYIKEFYYTPTGMQLVTSGASDTTYYCDAMWYTNSITAIPHRGYQDGCNEKNGLFSTYLSDAASKTAWYISASLSARPLS